MWRLPGVEPYLGWHDSSARRYLLPRKFGADPPSGNAHGHDRDRECGRVSRQAAPDEGMGVSLCGNVSCQAFGDRAPVSIVASKVDRQNVRAPESDSVGDEPQSTSPVLPRFGPFLTCAVETSAHSFGFLELALRFL